jgi:hypothetical protein
VSPEKQRIAIAEACGWEQKPYGDVFCWYDPQGRARPVERDHKNRVLPNYLNDLNAMHEAEATLGEKRIRSYAFTLAQVLDTSPTVDLDDQFLNIHAAAAQRAEAFLRTLNLWTDEQ